MYVLQYYGRASAFRKCKKYAAAQMICWRTLVPNSGFIGCLDAGLLVSGLQRLRRHKMSPATFFLSFLRSFAHDSQVGRETSVLRDMMINGMAKLSEHILYMKIDSKIDCLLRLCHVNIQIVLVLVRTLPGFVTDGSRSV